ncbi:MAG TPA: glycosyltransferase family 4 protein [Planctomycetaceae bacterium]|nr:glycosyltransferase family 4 protein [Planctomycetaceae bacterium]
MNVLLFAGRFEVRGSSQYTLRLAQHLGGHAVVPSIVCSDAGQVDSGTRAEMTLREYPQLGLPLWGRVVMDLVRRDFDEAPPDLIHIQTRSVLSQGVWLARRLERPAVLTVHDYLGPRERLRVDRDCVRRIIAVSDAVKADLLERERFPDEFVTVIHSGVDVPEVVDAPPVLDPGHVPVVGTAGPLEAVKGLPFFLGAAAQVLAVRESIEFLVAGAGPEERNLRRLARELGITGRVTFIPRLYDFSQSLEAMDIYCLPSLRQGLGTIMLEAMARARPVIATGVGGVYSAIRDNETGLVVPPSDSGRLAERFLELLDDPVRARAIGESGRRLVREEFGVEKMIERTAKLYRAACVVPLA